MTAPAPQSKPTAVEGSQPGRAPPIHRIEMGMIVRCDAFTNENFEADDEALIFLNNENEQTCLVEGPNAKAMAAQIVEAVNSHATLQARVDELTKALEPFAKVAVVDIGQDETDADTFQPMRSGYNREPLITVGDMRRAASVISLEEEKSHG